MTQSDEFRRQARMASERASATKSLTEAARERRREKALDHLAENADWLDGKTGPASKDAEQS